MRIIVIGNPQTRRTNLFAAACLRRAIPFQLIPWAKLLRGAIDLRTTVKKSDVVRIDSPGEDFEVEKLLLQLGAEADESSLCRSHINNLVFDRGRVWWPDIWFQGFRLALGMLHEQLHDCPEHHLPLHPQDILTMFDKTATHDRLSHCRIPVPPAMGAVRNFDDLVSQMQLRNWESVFIKLRTGSSASGTVALRISASHGMKAYTTVQLDARDDDGSPKIYNTLAVRSLSSPLEISRVVNAICRFPVHVERWLPKAGIEGRTFDLRVFVVDAQPCHVVVRKSRSPMTNLHLLNDRGEPDAIIQRCGRAAWLTAMSSCSSAMKAFPSSLYGGIDLLISPDFRKHFILEINAFGDWLNAAIHNGQDTYDAEIEAMTRKYMEAA